MAFHWAMKYIWTGTSANLPADDTVTVKHRWTALARANSPKNPDQTGTKTSLVTRWRRSAGGESVLQPDPSELTSGPPRPCPC